MINNDVKNVAIIIGGDHYNTLGVIRSLGMNLFKSKRMSMKY